MFANSMSPQWSNIKKMVRPVIAFYGFCFKSEISLTLSENSDCFAKGSTLDLAHNNRTDVCLFLYVALL